MEERRLRKFFCFAAALLVLFAAGCSDQPAATSSSPDDVVVQINPLAEGVSTDETVARLYYGYGENRLLAGENRKIKVPMNESAETSVLNELIQEGPSASSVNFTQVINAGTRVVEVASEGQYTTVTFSRDFLEPVAAQSTNTTAGSPRAGGESERNRRYLAVYSVVNTLVEQGSCSRVRIMIDENGTGTGRPITYAEAGIPGTGDAEPFERNGDIELTPGTAMRVILDAAERRDWAQAYEFIALRNQYGQDRPSFDEMRAQAEDAQATVSGTKVIDYVMAPDGTGVITMISYDIKPYGREVQTYTNVPCRLVQENDVWKITWNVFEQMFLA